MGLSIRYKGRINDPKKLTELIEEVTDIAKSHEWDYTVFVDTFPVDNAGKRLFEKYPFGICLSPPKCEPVFICFRTDGRMTSTIELEYSEIPPDDRTDESLSYISVKTQYAGMEVHKIIINMFRHLSEKYFKSFSMSDESGYWETGDEKVMKRQFGIYNTLIDSFESELRNSELQSDESLEDYLIRIAESVKSKNPE